MQIATETLGPVTLLRPAGALDASTCAAFEARLIEALAGSGGQPAMVVVDLAEVEFISSAGLRALMVGAKRARAGGSQVAVAALTPIVREIFEISRFHHVVAAFDGVREAVASMSEDAARAFEARGL